MFGTPDEVISKLKFYEACGVDNFCYGASFGLPFERTTRSLQLFISEVMPHFRNKRRPRSEPQVRPAANNKSDT